MEFTSSAQNLVFENSNIKSILTRLTGADNIGDVAVTHWAIPIRRSLLFLAAGLGSEGKEEQGRWAHRREKFSGEKRAGGCRRRGFCGRQRRGVADEEQTEMADSRV
jgi:hypothetical protein